MTAEAPTANTAALPRPRYARRRQPFGDHIADTISLLQRDYFKKRSPAVAAMAQLRSAAALPPGHHYAILSHTRVPAEYLEASPGDGPTVREQAKHSALTLYAVHQQSIYDTPMHRNGQSLGAAINQLSQTTPSAEAVRRRFAALGTASTYDEAGHHLRSLIRLLRDRRIALDYGLLADDLVVLQRPNGRARVRAQWGREFYRVDTDDKIERRDTVPGTVVPSNLDIQE